MYHVLGKRDCDFWWDHIRSTRFYFVALLIVLMNVMKYDKLDIRRDGYVWKWDGARKVY